MWIKERQTERSCRWWEENGEVSQPEVPGKAEELSP